MATRSKDGGGGGGGDSSFVRPVFEDMRPTSEWQQDAEFHNLIIHLPGFTKEQIKASTEGRNIIRVSGERMVASNKWSRFQEDFQVPDESVINSVRARFQEGILYITLPKKRANKPQEAIDPHKLTSTEVLKQPTQAQERSSESGTTSDDPREKQVHQADVQRDRSSITKVPQDAERKDISSEKEKHIVSEKAEDEIRKMKVKEEKKSERSKEVAEDGDGVGGFSSHRYKKAVKGPTELHEERQLMVNIGIGVLIAMALSAYITYRFVSGEDKN